MSIEKNINYKFKDKSLLKQALTHPSICNQKSLRIKSNQRLEFLGDAVLLLIITDYIYAYYPDCDEGLLTKMRSKLISRDVFATIAGELSLSEYLVVLEDAKKMGIHLQKSTLCDSFEALIGAIYLDSCYDEVKQIIKPMIMPFVFDAFNWSKGNCKNLVQEYVQKNYKNLPDYRIKEVQGASHCPFYTVELYINNQYKSTGEGKNKKQAELDAAQKFLALMNLE